MAPRTRSKRPRGNPLEDGERSQEEAQLFQAWLISPLLKNVSQSGRLRMTENVVEYIWPISRESAISVFLRDIKNYSYSADSIVLNMKVNGFLGTYEFLTKEGKKIFMALKEKFMLHYELLQLNKATLPLISLNEMQFGATASVEGSDCGYSEREFTKEEVEELLNKKFDQGIAQQSATYHEDLKDCIKWYLKVEKDHPLQVERLRNLLNAAEKKCADTDELNAINSKLRQTIATLEEKLAKEESEKMDTISSQGMEKEARAAAEKLQVALSGELEKLREEKLVVEQRAVKFESEINQTQEYNKSLQQYNRSLQIEVSTMIELWKQNEFLQGQLQEVRDDRDCHRKENHDLKAEVLKHAVDTSSLKIKDLEIDSLKHDRLQARILELEQQIFEGERLRRKLRNEIQELKGNIRVFCRVRPLLRDDATAAEVPVISYPTSTECLGRGIDLVRSGKSIILHLTKSLIMGLHNKMFLWTYRNLYKVHLMDTRSVGKTHMNEQSSRSHLVFTLWISWINENSKQKAQGVLNLIDLAGSERVSSSGATGDRLKETKAINSSLSFLADVISSLAKKESHVPFRNSKLTHLLQPSLEGDSKVLMFVNVSPVSTSTEESLRSLQFAERVNNCQLRHGRRS